MVRTKTRMGSPALERMLGEASWLLSHAEALRVYGRGEESEIELARAAACEEHVACLLEADGRSDEAAVHRVSAASCFEQLSQFSRAVTLLHAALSTELPADYRRRIEAQLDKCLKQARKELRRRTAGNGTVVVRR
jgi:hypothetical protein